MVAEMDTTTTSEQAAREKHLRLARKKVVGETGLRYEIWSSSCYSVVGDDGVLCHATLLWLLWDVVSVLLTLQIVPYSLISFGSTNVDLLSRVGWRQPSHLQA